jgi:hypothetical protein
MTADRPSVIDTPIFSMRARRRPERFGSKFNACPELVERVQGWEIEPETLYPKH